MLIGGSYYALTLSALGTSSAAYFSVTPQSSLEISQGGVSMVPSSATPVMVNIYPQTLQIQAPSGAVNAGVTIVTSDTHVAGAVQVSPPVNVPVTIELWGTKLLGTYTLPANQQKGAFDFAVSPSESLPPDEVRQQIAQRLDAAER